MIRRSTVAFLLPSAILLLAGCGPSPVAQPAPCAAVFNTARCLTMTDWAAAELHERREDIVAIDVIPEPTPIGDHILMTRSGGPPIDVRVTLRDGSTGVVSMHCGAIPPMRDHPYAAAS